ncbi:MAG: hypothetical protein M1832_005303 [Thelocarpon impressellum]|nr:MAG: hypothetical protein M1832_005303 [Thelocarpon impressellum]
MAATEVSEAGAAVDTTPPSNRPKRVRTGECGSDPFEMALLTDLTCRERHLKCDEGMPLCQNCRKSNRLCKRGVRLNFIDTQVKSPPVMQTSNEWEVVFRDESCDIASEYKGGVERYAALSRNQPAPAGADAQFDFSSNGASSAPAMSQQPLPPIQTYPEHGPASLGTQARETHHSHNNSTSEAGSYSNHTFPPPQSSYSNPEQTLTPPSDTQDYLNSPEEVLLMQVFVEEVGLWMDSMDPMKHFSRLLPFHSLGEPMLLNAFLACGARHLTLVNPTYHEDKALNYYDTATRGLLKSLQDPNRDTVICATTAVILNVYEIMSERALQRMNHIAGARALIKECGWSARSTGIGSACFWLNVGMELLSCLHFNWRVAWGPDDWGVDMDFSRETEVGREEIWTHRILYIVGKVANFRASIPRYQEADPRDEQIRLQNRYAEWKRLKDWCDSWNENIPRTMHPLAYLYPYQTTSKSAFPEVWLIKRTTIVARLFYHTAMCLLSQMNPMLSKDAEEMHVMMQSHSHQICGITAHVKDRGVASVAIRSLAIAGECLVVRREQEEVLQIFEKIRKETGWRVGFLLKELPEKWGWGNDDAAFQQQQQQQQQQDMMQQHSLTSYSHYPATSQSQSQSSLPPAPPVQRKVAGITNPLYTNADFSAPQHPYQSHYVAPNQHPHHSHYNF